MNRTIVFATALLGLAALAFAQKPAARKKEDGPQPRVVSPGANGRAPSDAIVLFDGKDLSNWVMYDGAPADWTLQDGVLVCRTGAGNIESKARFGSAQIHIEFNVPSMPERSGQARGNSGVMLHARGNEIQVLDSYNNPTYADGSCGGVYGVAAPLVNASRPPGEWQSYDIIYLAPVCGEGGQAKTPGSVTIVHNGVLIQNQTPIAPQTGCLEEGPLILQDHNGFRGLRVPPGKILKTPVTPVGFRNIWLRPLSGAPAAPVR